ncbi:MAG: hypothetical protein HY006_03050 [Candidatus Sungbacteria bacterium]|nr:hypothetical protein [Candidatus Sungbacteria bacterium]
MASLLALPVVLIIVLLFAIRQILPAVIFWIEMAATFISAPAIGGFLTMLLIHFHILPPPFALTAGIIVGLAFFMMTTYLWIAEYRDRCRLLELRFLM